MKQQQPEMVQQLEEMEERMQEPFISRGICNCKMTNSNSRELPSVLR